MLYILICYGNLLVNLDLYLYVVLYKSKVRRVFLSFSLLRQLFLILGLYMAMERILSRIGFFYQTMPSINWLKKYDPSQPACVFHISIYKFINYHHGLPTFKFSQTFMFIAKFWTFKRYICSFSGYGNLSNRRFFSLYPISKLYIINAQKQKLIRQSWRNDFRHIGLAK